MKNINATQLICAMRRLSVVTRVRSVLTAGLTTVALSAVGCSAGMDEQTSVSEPAAEELGTVDDALFDGNTIDESAKLALLAAGVQTVASAFDPLSGFQQVEFCGWIYKKKNGKFRADFARTDYDSRSCKATSSPLAGETRVGFYHTHPLDADPGFSPGDKSQAKSKGLPWYVISTFNACARKFKPTPAPGADTSLGCFPGSF